MLNLLENMVNYLIKYINKFSIKNNTYVILKMDYEIKTAYKYFDETTQLWNLFIFIKYCSITFCIQSVRKDYTILTEPKIFSDHFDTNEIILAEYYMFNCCKKGFDIVYTFESNNDVNKSIYELKQFFGKKLKKQNITKTLYKSTKCFNCMCCNWFVYMLAETYKKNKQNIIDNGIYAKQVIEFGKDKILKNLEDAIDIDNNNNKIITNDNKLIDIINKFINSKYNTKIFFDLNDLEYDHIPNNVFCDIEDCEYNTKLKDYEYYIKIVEKIVERQNMYYCYDCYKNEYIRDNYYEVEDEPCYNLCPNHFTKENICNHKDGKHKFALWSNELKDFDDYYRLKRCY